MAGLASVQFIEREDLLAGYLASDLSLQSCRGVCVLDTQMTYVASYLKRRSNTWCVAPTTSGGSSE